MEKSVRKLQEEGRPVPALARKLLDAGKTSFYQHREGYTYFYDIESGDYKRIEDRPASLFSRH